ncbi:MAG: FAD:protein FMN transferase [Acidiferrobacterales bacterium]
MVAIRGPRRRYKAVAVLPLSNAVISTPGDYERYFNLNGERYHHIINPRNGHSVSGIRSVTVIDADATTADALSTGVFVLGVRKGLVLIESLPDVEAVMIDADNEMHYSSGLFQQQSTEISRSSP